GLDHQHIAGRAERNGRAARPDNRAEIIDRAGPGQGHADTAADNAAGSIGDGTVRGKGDADAGRTGAGDHPVVEYRANAAAGRAVAEESNIDSSRPGDRAVIGDHAASLKIDAGTKASCADDAAVIDDAADTAGRRAIEEAEMDAVLHPLDQRRGRAARAVRDR